MSNITKAQIAVADDYRRQLNKHLRGSGTVRSARAKRRLARTGTHDRIQMALKSKTMTKTQAKSALRIAGWRRRDSRGRFA